jgi:hypothetical protein
VSILGKEGRRETARFYCCCCEAAVSCNLFRKFGTANIFTALDEGLQFIIQNNYRGVQGNITMV